MFRKFGAELRIALLAAAGHLPHVEVWQEGFQLGNKLVESQTRTSQRPYHLATRATNQYFLHSSGT